MVRNRVKRGRGGEKFVVAKHTHTHIYSVIIW
jgi:hypothetical protein